MKDLICLDRDEIDITISNAIELWPTGLTTALTLGINFKGRLMFSFAFSKSSIQKNVVWAPHP